MTQTRAIILLTTLAALAVSNIEAAPSQPKNQGYNVLFIAPTEETKDYMACQWAADQLARNFDGKPFFLALGISKPHLPWYVPQQFFDLYPIEEVQPAAFRRDDLDDIARENGRPIFKPSDRFRLADGTNMHKQANRAYLANVSYVDHCIGVTLDALEASEHADKTIVMIWGDHGWHLSEKLHYPGLFTSVRQLGATTDAVTTYAQITQNTTHRAIHTNPIAQAR